jgi:phage terminase large subunit-like protein
MLQLGLRRGKRPRVLVTTTPRPGPVLKGIMAAPACVATGGPSWANPHVSRERIAEMRTRYAGTRLERQELNGELLTDNPGALWTEALLERCRVGAGDVIARSEATRQSSTADASGAETGLLRCARNDETAPHESTTFLRLIIAVDPPTGDGTCGIIATAKDNEGKAHILADHSVTEQSPEAWSRVVAEAAALWTHLHPNAPLLVVAESNQGGLMVQSVLRISGPALKIKLVPAIQGKSDRAAPVAMLFEAGRVVLHGRFPELEAQLCGMIAGGEYEGPGSSPDRADAMVWGLTELMLQKERASPQIRRL